MTTVTQGWSRAERAQLLEDIPSGVAVLGRDLTVVDQNRAYTELFGDGRGRRCHEVSKGCSSPCEECPAGAVFDDGMQRVIEQRGTDRHG